MSAILRFPVLLFAAGVDQLRRLPGARLTGPLTKWLARLLLLAALFLTALWAAEASPQRISLAELTAGRLGSLQTWIIVTGDLADDPTSTPTDHVYRLTDPAAPNAYLVVRSPTVQALGRTTVSGHIEGGRDGVPPGYAWSARLNADPRLAAELPPPWTAIALAGLGVLIIVARRTRYPLFRGETPTDALPATSALRVDVRSESGELGRATMPATLSFTSSEPGTADLSMSGTRRVPVRLHSAFTTVDVGLSTRLSGSDPALRVRSDQDDLILSFASRRERDAAFAALGADGQLRRTSNPTRVVSTSSR